MNVSVNAAGRLVITSTYTSASEKKRLEAMSAKLGERFQMEVLAIVAQLLNYHTQITQEEKGGSTILVLEGEKHTDNGVHKYLKITKDSQGDGVIQFEHFASPKELDDEQRKLQALAQKLGVDLKLTEVIKRSGHPIPAGAEHAHFLKEGS